MVVQFGGLPKPYLSSERDTITEFLKRNGYSTGAFVQPSPLLFHNYERGFDKFDYLNTVQGRLFHSIFKVRSILQNLLTSKNPLLPILQRIYGVFQRTSKQASLFFGKVPYQRASSINFKAIKWLKTLDNNTSNIFLWMHYMDPHQPYLPIKMNLLTRISTVRLNKKVHSSALKTAPIKRSEDLNEDELKQMRHLYEEEIKYVDSQIGSFLTDLKKIGIDLENSYIVLTADHGEEFMEHGELEHHRKLYDELIHVPLIMCGPGIPCNRRIQDQVSLIDITPTLLNLLGYSNQKKFQGKSLLPIINGQNVSKRAAISEYLFSVNVKGFSYRTEEYKYILKLDGDQRYHELFNLLKDPEEKNNLTGEEELINTFERKIQTHILNEQRLVETIAYKEHLKEKIRSFKKPQKSLN
jgi:hypothetical protein